MTQINGPINLIRVEGIINNIKKIFYLFMDLHIDPSMQNECEDIRSIHIRNYLVNNFDQLTNTNRTVDFFIEDFPDGVMETWNATGIYLDQLRSMFNKIYDFDFK